MFQIIALMVFAVYGVSTAPTVLYNKPVVIADVPEMPQLAGIDNLKEKFLPIQPHYPLPGTRNNAERIQVDFTRDFRGNENLAEKAIPEMQLYREAHIENNY